ncbi:outer membrane beta-barrel protein [Ciceribacter sp. L1K22]|uniref:outer membrane beta-barrel protein n=1 Tax=Ciceribacter sp. L1K22 TaxID=2820275 RepID=UPI001ABE1CBB|nr:outer membrane beta-barrel protein [Ciceribacter sp. L1K22]
MAVTLMVSTAFICDAAAQETSVWPQVPEQGTTAPVDPYGAPPADATTSAMPTAAIPSDTDLRLDETQVDGRENLPQAPVDREGSTRNAATDSSGVRLGTMILRPSLTQSLRHETIKSGNKSESTLYSDTQLKGTLTSDWSRHQLTVNTQGTWENVLSGDGDEGSGSAIDGELRLDLSEQTTARLTAGYDFSREDPDADEAIAGATTQYGIHRLDAGASIERDFGRLRGRVGIGGSRWIHTDAELAGGGSLSQSFRDRNLGTVTARLGYEVSPALIPFIEASAGRLQYDEKVDPSGYRRSSDIYTGKVGIAADFEDKLRGEIGVGYAMENFDDNRLDDLKALALSGNLAWSPRYGTDVNLDLSTSFDPSSSAGTSGSVVYGGRVNVTQQLRERLVASLTGSTDWTRYPDLDNADSTTYGADASLSYEINRYLAVSAGVGYEYTQRDNALDDETIRATIGVTAKR